MEFLRRKYKKVMFLLLILSVGLYRAVSGRPTCKITTIECETDSTEEPTTCSLPKSFIKLYGSTKGLNPKKDCVEPYDTTVPLVPNEECTDPEGFIRWYSTTISTTKRTTCSPDGKFSQKWKTPVEDDVTLKWPSTTLSTTVCTSPSGFFKSTQVFKRTCITTETKCTSPRKFEKYYKTQIHPYIMKCPSASPLYKTMRTSTASTVPDNNLIENAVTAVGNVVSGVVNAVTGVVNAVGLGS
ncbi:hypothetical protein CHUAL_000230 [Chamberlinius hualienensis]